MSEIRIVRKPEIKALVIHAERSGHEVRSAWRELQQRMAGTPGLAGVRREEGLVFIPEWQWATEVKELWVGVEVDSLEVIPDGAKALHLPARTYATVRVHGDRASMDATYGSLWQWFEEHGYERDTSEGVFGFEANRLQPVNPFDIPADVIDFFDFDIYAPIRHAEPSAEKHIHFTNTAKRITARNVDLSGSSVRCADLEDARFEDVNFTGLKVHNANMTGMKISDANLSDIEIDGAQLGGAYIRNIGLPPECHPMHEPGKEQRPLRFENCNLNESTFQRCRLVNVELTDCDITGLTINGVRIDELLAKYKS